MSSICKKKKQRNFLGKNWISLISITVSKIGLAQRFLLLFYILNEIKTKRRKKKNDSYIKMTDEMLTSMYIYCTFWRVHTQITAQLFLGTGIRIIFVIEITNSFEKISEKHKQIWVCWINSDLDRTEERNTSSVRCLS